MKRKREVYLFEMTDTFGGDTNYSWVERFIVESVSERGAISKLSRETGFRFRNDGLFYRAKGACIAAYLLDPWDKPSADWLNKAKVLT